MDFRKNLRKSYKVQRDESDGTFYLLHEVKPGRNKDVMGERTRRYGWRIIPEKVFVMHIMIEVSHGHVT